MADTLAALRSSVTRLHNLTESLDEDGLRRPAYPKEWTVAHVLSHLGSAAVIMQRRFEDALAGRATPDDFSQDVWDTWNSKNPIAQRDDALAADAALLARFEAATADERANLVLVMGPMRLGFDAFVAIRLNEHAVHTWDIEVSDDPSATLPAESASLVVDNLDMIAGYTAQATPGPDVTVRVRTTEPERHFTITLTSDGATFAPSTDTTVSESALVELPAEALIRLVYGRLDRLHTPPAVAGDTALLDRLRATYPGP